MEADMQHKFIVTKNVKKFVSAAENINHKLVGMERMALVAGEAGLGKSETALWYHARNGAVYIRVAPGMKALWLFRSIVRELGQEPEWRTEYVVGQLKKILSARPRVIILDEVDELPRETLEGLRYIHDIVHCPMIFIGEENAPEKFSRYPRLLDRFVEIVRFESLSAEDIKYIASEFSEVQFTPDAIERISVESEGKFRRILTMIHKAERFARINQIKSISAKEVR
jgi:DNA transposition AAA+ family ATPase